MRFEIDYIEKIAELVAEKGLTEITLEDGEKAIIIRKEQQVITTQAVAAPVSAPVAIQPAIAVEKAPSAPAAVDKGTAVTSPMVGTFYKSPSPDSDPFIAVGQAVKQGQVVCIIEAMKLMNEIEAEIAGTVTEICVEDGQPVEFGQVLMYIK